MAASKNRSAHSLPSDASVLEYARYHGICRDYENDHPLEPLHLPRAPMFLSQDLADTTGCSKLCLPQPPDPSDRLEINAAAVAELASILKPPQAPQSAAQYSNPQRFRDFKVDPPILTTDHELDTFKLRKRDSLRLSDVHLPPEHTEDRDEGLQWPSWCDELVSKFDKEIASDKLCVPKEVLLYLHSIRTQPPKSEIPESPPQMTKKVESLTPPLLPSDPPFMHVSDPSSSSSTGQIQLLSEATNSTAAEAEALEVKVLQQDRIDRPGTPGLKQFIDDPMLLDSIEGFELEESTHPLPSRRHAATLKVEVPLTPPSTFASALCSSVEFSNSMSFPDAVLEIISYATELPSKYKNGNDVLDSENDLDVFFQEQVGPIAEKADRQVEYEILQEVDTTKRVEVPSIDFEPLIAPWDEYSLKPSLKKDGIYTEIDAQRRLLFRCALEEVVAVPKWHESMKQEMGMLWNPFPKNFDQAALTESIRHDTALNQVICNSSLGDVGIINCDSLVLKLEGLRVLDDAEDIEEISAWHFEPGNDMASLLQQRRLEIADDGDHRGIRPVVPFGKDPAIATLAKKRKRAVDGPHQRSSNGDYLFKGFFSTSGSLDQFMHAQTGKGLPDPDTTHESPEEHDKTNRSTPYLGNDADMQDETPRQAPGTKHNTPRAHPLPPPLLPTTLPPKPFIISTSLLTRRRALIRQIQTLYPAVHLTERDTTPSADPDIMLSPSTGLLLTTLQHIKQRPLPGQQQTLNSVQQPLQTQIALSARKFARLLVLVSEGVAAPPRLLDARDCAALASLNGFVSSIRAATVTVSYVPGGEEELARWVVAAMSAHGRTAEELVGEAEDDVLSVLQEEEGLWELFLRRAGMNAFAAQVVLARLKEEKLERSKGSDRGRGFGLVEFVRMGVVERMEMFADVVGGGEMLGVVGERVDRAWMRVK
ncbi:hypothetical protein MPH_09448 [Macrophomina phaseolina MS6]|uniref:Uncharacterized protein n=1 Tax=Macrophomina phaseolina (strain MS6) TaxID=1126212 RepID=K2RKP2_MACPH|nr:hypothetical protein MPH_09448 [Macrophomina phaseolina MS6]